MPRQNRVDPFGDLHADSALGMFTGNRGGLIDNDGTLSRHHNGTLWITCLTDYRDWSHPLDAPRTWTPLFFLDDAVALSAGHRPCGLCRRGAYEAYRSAVSEASDGAIANASTINRTLASQRLRRGRGLQRRTDRITWRAQAASLPVGTVILLDGEAHLIGLRGVQRFAFSGWEKPEPIREVEVEVLTPKLSVAAMAHGFAPMLHGSAAKPR